MIDAVIVIRPINDTLILGHRDALSELKFGSSPSKGKKGGGL